MIYESFLECAVEAANKAGKLLLEGFGTSFKIRNKEGRNNLVTEFDIISEKVIIEHIKSKFPDSSILAEESGNNSGNNNLNWIIDPLDGTVNFAHGLPIFSISIAVEYQGRIVVGVVYNPILNEMFTAIEGKGAFLNSERIYVSNVDDYHSSFLVTGFPYNVDKNPYSCIDTFVNVVLAGIPVRRLGSAALDLAYVACGRFDGFWEINLNPWDVAAGYLLVKESGGVVTQYNNAPYSVYDKTIIATNNKIHNDVIKLIGDASCDEC